MSSQTNSQTFTRKLRRTILAQPQRFGMLAFAVMFASVGTYLYLGADAARLQPAGLSITPVSSSVKVGDTVAITIWENSNNTPTNAVQADISYPNSSFDFVDIDTANSAFDVKVLQQGGEGKAQVARATHTPLSGRQLVATIHLRAKSPAQKADIKIDASSALIDTNTNSNIISSTGGASYKISE